MPDLHARIVAELDRAEAGLRQSIAALRLAAELHYPEPWHEGDHPDIHATLCAALCADHPQHRCAGCSQLDDDLSGVTVAWPCRELVVVAGALGVPIEGGEAG